MFHVDTCPQCNKHGIALSVVQLVLHGAYKGSIYFDCPNCHFPSCGIVDLPDGRRSAEFLGANASTDSLKVKVLESWPAKPIPEIPASLPLAAERAVLQAETNFHNPGHDEAAAVMYRKALEVALKTIAPETSGTLASRIRELAKTGQITDDLAEWAKEIKNLGNDGAHEMEAIERKELEAMRGLTKMLLTYLFTLPEQVRSLRSSSEAKP